MAVRFIGALVVLALATPACITVTGSRVRPGFMKDLSSPRRDPNPMADLNEELRAPPATEAVRETLVPGSHEDVVEHVAAMIAGLLAGAMPILTWSGTFDENRMFDPAARRTDDLHAVKAGASAGSDSTRSPRE